ncbi:MAG: sigma-70 family RNA polymerase sigma factor [Planctomycetota bacterium]
MWPSPSQVESLLDAAAAGAPQAVDALLAEHRAGLRRVVAARFDARLAGRLDVSDIVQDVLLDAHRQLGEFLRQRPMPFHLWLRCLARDRAVAVQRAHRAALRDVGREVHALVAPAVDQRTTQALAALLRADGPSPLSLAARRELAARLDQAMQGLDEIDREVLLMRHHEQLTNQEVARVLGLSEPAAAMRYMRALQRLKARIAADDSAREGR